MISIKIPIYRTWVKIYVTNNFRKKADQLQLGLTLENATMEGVTIACQNGVIIILLEPKFTPGILMHEILHAAKAILRHVGIPISDHSEEAEAYLVTYIVDEYYRITSKPRNPTAG